VYLWADGLYVKAGLEREKAALLVVIGAFADGRKEVLAITPGYRESTLSRRTSCMYHNPANIANPSDNQASRSATGSTPIPHH
jgi:hypothetical protein